MVVARVSRQVVHVVARAPQLVVPRPLPVSLPFLKHANWSTPPEIETAWSTDVVRSDETLAQDRKGLVSRPTRRIRARLLGKDVHESYAVMIAAMRQGQHQACPVPLYGDRSIMLGNSSGDSTTREVPCDTRWRRLHYGARVGVALEELVNDATSYTSFALGTIKEIYEDRLVIAGMPRDYPEGAWIYPLLDCEVSLDAEGSLVTDGVFDIGIEALEIIGSSALPASWVGSLNAFFPYAQLGASNEPGDPRGKLVFDLSPNWNISPKLRIVRDGDRTLLGTGSTTRVRGDRPTIEYTYQLDEFTREDFWKVIRCHDGIGGRLETFWLPFPTSPWQLIEIDPSGLYAKVASPRNRSDLQAFFQYVSITTDLLPGYYQVREINEVSELSPGIFSINWIEPITVGVSFPIDRLNVRPMDLVQFKEDALTERWLTDEVVSATVVMVSALAEQSAPIQNLVQAYPVVPPQYNSVIEAVPDLDLWFAANTNVFSKDGQGNFLRASSWPAKYCDATQWFDVRSKVPEAWHQGRYFEFDTRRRLVNLSVDPDGHVNTPRDLSRNFGASTIVSPRFELLRHNNDFQQYMPMSNKEKALWGDATKGWTLIVVLTPGEPLYFGDLTHPNNQYGPGQAIVVKDTANNTLFEWTWTIQNQNNKQLQARARMHETPTGPPFDIYHSSPTFYVPIIMVLRVQPSGAGAQVYMNGTGQIPGSPWLLVSPLAPNQMAMPAPGQTFAKQVWFGSIAYGIPKSSTTFEQFWGRRQYLDGVLNFKRQLSNVEMNAVCGQLAIQYGATWGDV